MIVFHIPHYAMLSFPVVREIEKSQSQFYRMRTGFDAGYCCSLNQTAQLMENQSIDIVPRKETARLRPAAENQYRWTEHFKEKTNYMEFPC